MLKRVENWASFLRDPRDEQVLQAIRSCERTGRLRGTATFVKRLEKA